VRAWRVKQSISASGNNVKQIPIDYHQLKSTHLKKTYLTGTNEAGTFKAKSPFFEIAKHKSGNLPANFAAR
jgi:hypothetical protein